MSLRPETFLDEESMQMLQDRYKKKIPSLFATFTASEKFRFIVNQLELNDLQFTIADVSQTDEILTLMNTCYTSSNPLDILLGNGSSVKQIDVAIKRVKKSISLNRCFIAVDVYTKRIIGAIIWDDLFAHFFDPFSHETVYKSKHIQKHIAHMVEIYAAAEYDITKYKQEYGRYCYANSAAIAPSHTGRYIFLIIGVTIGTFLHDMCGYQHGVLKIVHPKIYRVAKHFLVFGKIIRQIDYSQYTFNDGTKIDAYFEELKNKKPQMDMKKFKKSCKIITCIFSCVPMETLMTVSQIIKNSKRVKKSKL